MARHRARHGERDGLVLHAAPFLHRLAGDHAHIVARFLRQPGALRQPVGHALRPRIVGGGRKAEIAEAVDQRAQQLGRSRQRLASVEGIIQANALGRVGHELRDAHRADRADRHMIEAALLPDQVGEEAERQRVRLRDLDEAGAKLRVRERRRARFGERQAGALERGRRARILRRIDRVARVAIARLRRAEVKEEGFRRARQRGEFVPRLFDQRSAAAARPRVRWMLAEPELTKRKKTPNRQEPASFNRMMSLCPRRTMLLSRAPSRVFVEREALRFRASRRSRASDAGQC